MCQRNESRDNKMYIQKKVTRWGNEIIGDNDPAVREIIRREEFRYSRKKRILEKAGRSTFRSSFNGSITV